MASHQQRSDDWEAKKASWQRPAGGGLLGPMPTAPAPKRKRRKKDAPTQKQIDHPWAYLVGWYEEIRNHTPAGLGLQRILFSEIRAWKDLYEVETEPWEIDALTRIDVVWFEALPKDPKKGD